MNEIPKEMKYCIKICTNNQVIMWVKDLEDIPKTLELAIKEYNIDGYEFIKEIKIINIEWRNSL